MAVTEPRQRDRELRLVDMQAHANGLLLFWSDGHSAFFHHIWLRDCCYCALCGDSFASKRFFLPSDAPLDSVPGNAGLTEDGALEVLWRPDGHRSRYEAEFLRRFDYSEVALAHRRHCPKLWDASIAEALPVADFEAVRDDEEAALDLLRKLRDFGFVLVRGGPREPDGIRAHADLVGEMAEATYGQIFDLSTKASVQTLGNTMLKVPPHTDEAYRAVPPGILVLFCVRPAASGGESVLVDGFQIADKLRQEDPEAFALLARVRQPFHRIHDGRVDQRTRAPVLVLDDRGELVGFRFHTRTAAPLDLPSELVEPVYAANHRLSALMTAPENQLRFTLGSGEAVLFDNHRVMHSRRPFDDPRRFLRICNVSRESFHQRLRLLAAQQGYPAEADQVLAAGVTG